MRIAAVAVLPTLVALLGLAVSVVVIVGLVRAVVVFVAGVVGLYGRAYRLALSDGKLAVARVRGVGFILE